MQAAGFLRPFRIFWDVPVHGQLLGHKLGFVSAQACNRFDRGISATLMAMATRLNGNGVNSYAPAQQPPVRFNPATLLFPFVPRPKVQVQALIDEVITLYAGCPKV